MSKQTAIVGASIFGGEVTHQNSALIFQNNEILAIVEETNIPNNCQIIELNGGTIISGFIDLQVNGGGGILFNDELTVEGIRTICRAHAKFGTTALLPTLITDTPEITKRAVDAGIEAYKQKVPGFIGLHLEGPHLSQARKGAHDTGLIRPMKDSDLETLLFAGKYLPNLKITLAPESVSNEQISILSKAGILVSLGHSACSFKTAMEAIEAGAKCVTHLFNAMSPLTHREAGLVGAALNSGKVSCGIIADGHHVKEPAMQIALAAKNKPGKIFLVTDAMSNIGTNQTSFILNGRTISRENGVLTLDDGTLAGADLNMISAVNMIQELGGVNFEEAIRMATLYPAQCLGISQSYGHLSAGAIANIVHINESQKIENVWLNGDLTLDYQ